MVNKRSFIVQMSSLSSNSGYETKNIEIGTVGKSKWFLSLAYIRDGWYYEYEIQNVCFYRICDEESRRQEFDVYLYRDSQLLTRKKITSENNYDLGSINEILSGDDQLRGSITVLDNPEGDSDDQEDSEDDEIDSDLEIKSVSQSEEETTTYCCSSAQLMNDFHRLLGNPDSFSDATLKCGSDTILVHKNILSARSPVFAAMFQQKEMREGRDGEVVVDDIRPDVVRAMLEYIYTGKSDHVAADSMAGDLLFVADKYQLQELKSICVGKLRSNMAASNVLRNLVLGDLHDRGRLKACAIEFICKNKKMSKLEKSEDWKSLQKERPELAMEVMASMVKYLQK